MDRIVQLFLLLERLRHERDDLIRSKAQAEQIAAIEKELVGIVRQILGSQQAADIASGLFQIGRDWMQDSLDRARFGPCEAAEPARHLRAAYACVAEAMRNWRAWAGEQHFAWMPVVGTAVFTYKASPFQVLQQIECFQGALVSASERTTAASNTLQRVRDVRVHLGAQPGMVPVTSACSVTTIVPIPEGVSWTQGRRLQEARRCMLRTARQLDHAVEQGIKRLNRANLDAEGTLVRPEAVSASLADLNFIIVCGLFTCAALTQLVHQRASEETMVSRNM